MITENQLVDVASISSQAQPEAHSERLRDLIAESFGGICVLLAVAASILTYSHAIDSGFLPDELVFVQRVHPFTLSELPWLFSVHSWFYRPIFLTWFAVGLRLFGTDPVNFHASMIILQAICITIAGYWTYLSTNSRIASLGTGFWIVMCRQIDFTVNWISASGDMLACLFALLCLIFLVKAEQETGKRQRALLAFSLFSCALALLSKEASLCLAPIIALTLYGWTSGKIASRLDQTIARFNPYLAIFAAYMLLDARSLWVFAHSTHPWFARVIYFGDQAHPVSLALKIVEMIQASADTFLPGIYSTVLPVGGAIVGLLATCALFVYADRSAKSKTIAASALFLMPIIAILPSVYSRGLYGGIGQYAYIPDMLTSVAITVAATRLIHTGGRGQGIAGALLITAYLLRCILAPVV